MKVGAAFDLEGTSVDLEPLRHQAHLRAAASFGIEMDYEFAVTQLPHFVGGPDEQVAEDVFELHHEMLPPDREAFVGEFLERDKAEFEKQFAECEVKAREGLVDFLDWLDRLNVPNAIGSLTRREQALVIMERADLTRRFRGRVVLREDVATVKPAPDVFLATANLLDINPRGQIVFDDSPRGIVAGHRAHSHPIGMPVVTVASARSALVQAGPIAVFESWLDPELRSFVERLVAKIRTQPDEDPIEARA